MKLSYLIKATPFLSTLLLIIFLNVRNQNEYTKIRILIWTTPSLSLGNYLAISTGTGFLLSYFITTKLGNTIQSSQKHSLGSKEEDKYEESLDYNNTVKDSNQSYENTLIERDINDPSPTINASFRVIGRTERSSINYKTTYKNDPQCEVPLEFEEDFDEQSVKNNSINQPNSIIGDWDDNTYSEW